MAWMLVTREGNFRRPRSIYSFNFKPSPEPQEYPADVVAYAIAKGMADPAKAPSQTAAKALKARRRPRTKT